MREYLILIGERLNEGVLPILLDVIAIIFGIGGILVMALVLLQASSNIDLIVGFGIGAISIIVLFIQRISQDIKKNKE